MLTFAGVGRIFDVIMSTIELLPFLSKSRTSIPLRLRTDRYSPQQIEELADMIGNMLNGEWKEFVLKTGGGRIRTTIEYDNLVVGEVIVDGGSVMGWHSHKVTEYFGVISGGQMRVSFDSPIRETQTISDGQSIRIEPGQLHMVEYLGDSKQWFVIEGVGARNEVVKNG